MISECPDNWFISDQTGTGYFGQLINFGAVRILFNKVNKENNKPLVVEKKTNIN